MKRKTSITGFGFFIVFLLVACSSNSKNNDREVYDLQYLPEVYALEIPRSLQTNGAAASQAYTTETGSSKVVEDIRSAGDIVMRITRRIGVYYALADLLIEEAQRRASPGDVQKAAIRGAEYTILVTTAVKNKLKMIDPEYAEEIDSIPAEVPNDPLCYIEDKNQSGTLAELTLINAFLVFSGTEEPMGTSSMDPRDLCAPLTAGNHERLALQWNSQRTKARISLYIEAQRDEVELYPGTTIGNDLEHTVLYDSDDEAMIFRIKDKTMDRNLELFRVRSCGLATHCWKLVAQYYGTISDTTSNRDTPVSFEYRSVADDNGGIVEARYTYDDGSGAKDYVAQLRFNVNGNIIQSRLKVDSDDFTGTIEAADSYLIQLGPLTTDGLVDESVFDDGIISEDRIVDL